MRQEKPPDDGRPGVHFVRDSRVRRVYQSAIYQPVQMFLHTAGKIPLSFLIFSLTI